MEFTPFLSQNTNVLQRQHNSILYKTKTVLFKNKETLLDLAVLK